MGEFRWQRKGRAETFVIPRSLSINLGSTDKSVQRATTSKSPLRNTRFRQSAPIRPPRIGSAPFLARSGGTSAKSRRALWLWRKITRRQMMEPRVGQVGKTRTGSRPRLAMRTLRGKPRERSCRSTRGRKAWMTAREARSLTRRTMLMTLMSKYRILPVMPKRLAQTDIPVTRLAMRPPHHRPSHPKPTPQEPISAHRSPA